MPKKSEIKKEYERLEINLSMIAKKEIKKIEKEVKEIEKEAEKVGEEIESSMTEKRVKSKKPNKT